MQIFLLVGYWWLIFLGFSLLFYPLSRLLLGKLADGGWLVGKLIGWLVLTYLTYVLGLTHLAPFQRWSQLLVLVGVGLLNWVVLRKISKVSLHFNRSLFFNLLIGEVVFFGLLLGMAFVRGFNPDIYGLEKYMDYGFIQGILNSGFFPPKDMWWAGGFINYYYFGHLQMAYLIKLTGVTGAVGFNLGLATIFGLSGSLIYLFVKSWTGSLWAALLGSFLHLGIGNLHLLTTITKVKWQDYWYPSASRLVEGIINEFPVYSFVVADLHGHVLNMPTDLLIVGILVEIFRNKLFDLKHAVLVGFLLGTAFMTNAWDLPIYLLVSLVVFGLYLYFYIRTKKEWLHLLKDSLLALLVVGVTIAPFWYYLIKVPLPVLPTPSHSPLYQLFQLWGFWLLLGASFWVFLIFIRKHVNPLDLLFACLVGVAVLLIIIPELVYVKDIYGAPYQRSNTVFKLTFQSWNIFGLTSGYLIWRIIKYKTPRLFLKCLGVVVLTIGIFGTFAYTVRAYTSGYGDFKTFKGLDGEKFISERYGQESVAGVSWLRNNTPTDAVIVEAAGESYSDNNYISSFSGRSTIVGWPVHEWLWRGSFDPVGKRQGEVNVIYTSNDQEAVKKILQKYKVGYVILGNLERQKYPGVPGQGLLGVGKVVFHQGEMLIYKVSW